MKFKVCYTLFLAAMLFVAPVFANNDKPDQKEYKYESVPDDPLRVRIYTLDNGLKVYISVNKDEPRFMTNIAVRAGSKNDPSDCTGLAHYLEHMLFKGTSEIASLDWEKEKELLKQISDLFEKHKASSDTTGKKKIYLEIDKLSNEAAKYCVPNEYDKMISSIGAKYTNAYTSVEQTVYINDIPSNELERWLMVESERFSELVLRIFHTELETVYEEFNRGQDNDYRKAYKAMNEALYKKHPYGTQSTIGTSEHLKNPSMEKIHDYFSSNYVPNNMAIIFAGDVDPDKTIRLVDKYFGKLKPKDVPGFTFEKEDPITEPETIDVRGPMAEWVSIGYRFPGIHSSERHYLRLMSSLLYNGEAGLIDLNIIQKQKALRARAGHGFNNDYSSLTLSANPKQGQSLEELRDLLLEQIGHVKKGEFDDWMLNAVIRDYRLSDERYYEYNFVRCSEMTNAFITRMDWAETVRQNDDLEKITKAQLVEWAKKNFGNNYIVVNKRTGEDKGTSKVTKPTITPIDINRDVQSGFYKQFEAMPETRLQPVYVDYQKDIARTQLANGIPFNSIENKTNKVFDLYYLLDMGDNSDDKLNMAVQYLPYLGTSKYSSEQLKKEFYKLGVSFDVFSSNDRMYVTLSGLESSLEQGVELFEHVLADVVADPEALKELVKDELKKREDNKKNKWRILNSAMYNYARYGPKSPYTDRLSTEELNALDPNELVQKIKSISGYEHRVFYYGSQEPKEVVSVLDKYHKVPKELKKYPEETKYKELETTENKVYFVDYDMVQTELLMISKDVLYDKTLQPYGQIFGEYFGSGLSSIVFQEIRESKALAYSAYSSFGTPRNKDEAHYIRAYVGTQSDKLSDAVDAMLKLMNEMPEAPSQFQESKVAALKKTETSRITKASIFWNYESAKRRGLDYDIRKDNYAKIKEMELKDLATFFNEHIKGRNYTYLVIGKKSEVDFEAMKKLGKVTELTLDEIFGYGP